MSPRCAFTEASSSTHSTREAYEGAKRARDDARDAVAMDASARGGDERRASTSEREDDDASRWLFEKNFITSTRTCRLGRSRRWNGRW